jgi:hypothetical protein
LGRCATPDKDKSLNSATVIHRVMFAAVALQIRRRTPNRDLLPKG